VPDMGARRCLGPAGNGVSLGDGGEGGPGPPESREDKQSTLSEEGGNMEKEEEGRVRDRRNRVSNFSRRRRRYLQV
jgi:hypothetical protein